MERESRFKFQDEVRVKLKVRVSVTEVIPRLFHRFTVLTIYTTQLSFLPRGPYGKDQFMYYFTRV